VLTY